MADQATKLQELKDQTQSAKEALDKLIFVGSLRQRVYLPSYIFKSNEEFEATIEIVDKILKHQGYVLRDIATAASGDRQACWRRKKE